MKPYYDFEKIKYSTDGPTFEKAVDIHEVGRVQGVSENAVDHSVHATVLGSKPYRVFVSLHHYDEGNCECYLGQRDILCKHMVALAIYAVMNGKSIPKEDKELPGFPVCSGRKGEINENELKKFKKAVTSAMTYIKPYNGPSKIWFAYQNSLMEGCNRLTPLVSKLPVSFQTATLLVNMLLRLERKICNGVDDSDGTVGGFMQQTVDVLLKYVEVDPNCVEAFKPLVGLETCFGFEEPLVRILDEMD
ncbi:hypothetical protein KKH43_06475 [Patescibacteria group bacterium]|nr:hypothetical protein [Patescibacteria group bacterium]